MKITKRHRFDYPIAMVWTMFSDPASHIAKFERMGHTDIEVIEEDQTETALDLTLRRQVEMEIPSVAKKLLSPTNTVTSIDHWEDRGDGTYGGTFDVDIKGAPAQSRGVTSLVPVDDDSCEYTVELEVKVNVPIIGDRVAKAISPQLESQLDAEFEAAEAWLAAASPS